MMKGYSLIASVAAVFLIFASLTRAQGSPEFLISYRAETFAPPHYKGKVLPTRESVVTVSFELVSGGKVADLSQNEVRWFVENELYRSGRGLKTFSFSIPLGAADAQRVKVAVLGYQGRTLEETVVIPVAAPNVVIEVRSKGNVVPVGEVLARALPYFFTVAAADDLSFTWTANGVETAGDDESPSILVLDASGGMPGDRVHLSVNAVNEARPIEAASDARVLEIR